MGFLVSYQAATRRLLNDVGAFVYSDTDLVTWINNGRAQLAIDSECLPQKGSLTTVVGQRGYLFSSISLVADPPGQDITPIGGAVKISSMGRLLEEGGPPGEWPMWGRSWPWFRYYYVQNPSPAVGPPDRWAVYQPGLFQTPNTGGTFYIDPIPDDTYTLRPNIVCVPIPLVDDTTKEALPYPWTDAVPYWAAYLALKDAQRTSDAEAMMTLYTTFARRGTQGTTPTQVPMNFPGTTGAAEAASHNLLTAVSKT